MFKRKEVLEFFGIVCKGIRDEYDQGASHRNLDRDKRTLKSMLTHLDTSPDIEDRMKISKEDFIPEIGKQYFYMGQEEWCDEDERYAETEVVVIQKALNCDKTYFVRSIIDNFEFPTAVHTLATTKEYVDIIVKKTHIISL